MAFDENMKELKNTNILKQSKNSDNNDNKINEFTFKKSTIADNSKLKSSIVDVIEMEEMDQTINAEQTAILGSNNKNKMDPLVHDYPLEITNSIGDDYVKLNNHDNNANVDYPDINHS